MDDYISEYTRREIKRDSKGANAMLKELRELRDCVKRMESQAREAGDEDAASLFCHQVLTLNRVNKMLRVMVSRLRMISCD